MDILTDSLHAVAQSLLWPCILGLLILLVVVLMELGALAFEWREIYRLKKLKVSNLIDLQFLKLPGDMSKRIRTYTETERHYIEERKRLSKQILDEEELRGSRILDKTDIIVKLGPMLGLMGTLIPLGPGLAALGKGDFLTLAAAVIVAFDTTVAGLAIGGIGYVISKIRRRWDEERVYGLETLFEKDLAVGGEEYYEAKQKPIFSVGGRN